MHASLASVNRAISQRAFSNLPIREEQVPRGFYVYRHLCIAWHGMAAWHVVPCLTARQDTTSEWYPGRWVDGRCYDRAVDGMTSFSVCAVLMLGTRCECAQLRIARWW
jgi:hypothetical protein